MKHYIIVSALCLSATLIGCRSGADPAEPERAVDDERIVAAFMERLDEVDVLVSCVPPTMRPETLAAVAWVAVCTQSVEVPSGHCIRDRASDLTNVLLSAPSLSHTQYGSLVGQLPMPDGCPALARVEARLAAMQAKTLEDVWLLDQALPWRQRACILGDTPSCSHGAANVLQPLVLPAGLSEPEDLPGGGWWVVQALPGTTVVMGTDIRIEASLSPRLAALRSRLAEHLAEEAALIEASGLPRSPAALILIDASVTREEAIETIEAVLSQVPRAWVQGEREGAPVRVEARALLAAWGEK